MHFKSTVTTAVLLCTCIISTNIHFTHQQQQSEKKQQVSQDGRAVKEPKTKTSGKLPRLSFDLGFFTFESFFQEQKLEDRLRLSKAYIKHHIRSKLIPSEDPLYTMKHSRVEELINCENLTSLVQPDRVPLIECRSLEAHTVDKSYVSPVSDLSITQYVRRSSFRVKSGGSMTKRSSRNDMLVYPLKRDVVIRHLESYVTANNLGDIKALKSNINMGYHVHAEVGSSDSASVMTCIGNLFVSVNQSEPGYFRDPSDPYPEYLDDINFLVEQAYKNGYLFSFDGFKCTKSDSLIDMSLNIDFTIVQRQEFPYLFVRHKMITQPHNVFLKYDAQVDQVHDNKVATSNPETYNTTVKIRSSSGLVGFMNFYLDQTISNEDIKSGMETASFINSNFPIIVQALWNEDLFFKHFRFLESVKGLSDNIKQPLQDLMNVSFTSSSDKDDVTVMANIKKSLLKHLNLDSLGKLLGLEDTVEYDDTPEDEQSLRDEL